MVVYVSFPKGTGCYLVVGTVSVGVFKGGIQNYKDFWQKISCSQMKLLNFENWSV